MGRDYAEDGTYTETGPVANATVTFENEGKEPVTKTTAEDGTVQFTMLNSISYRFTVKAATYKDTVFEFRNGGIVENYTWYIRKKAVYTGETVKVSGSVTLDGETVTTLPEGLSLRVTPAEADWQTAEVADGRYEFAAVPRGAATLQVHEADAIKNGQLAYEYRIKTPAEALELGEDAEVDQPIDIERFASKVQCTFSGLPQTHSGYVYLKSDGKTDTAELRNDGCVFRGILPGTYTLEVFCRQGYEPRSVPAEVVVTREADVTVPEITMVPAASVLNFVCDELLFHNKYIDSTIHLKHAFLELWNEDGTQLLDTVTSDSRGYFRLTHDGGRIGDQYRIKLFHPDIRPIQIDVTATAVRTDIVFENVAFKPIPTQVLDFAGVWDQTAKAVTLTWNWPEKMTDLEIAEITLDRRSGTTEPVVVNTWTAPAMDALPKTFSDDKAENGRAYTYACSIRYTNTLDTTLVTTLDIDLRTKYMLEYGANDAGMGEITSLFAPGEYLAGTEIKLTAKPKSGYTLLYWVAGTDKDTVTEATEFAFKLTQDTNLTAVFAKIEENVQYTLTLSANDAAWGIVDGGGTFDAGTEVTATATPVQGYKFMAWTNGNDTVSTSPAYKFALNRDMTLTAHFAPETGNENLEVYAWSVRSENGVLVINGLEGDRYTVYDLNGRMAGQAHCTGAEIRLTVAPNQLYVVRRATAGGAFGFKKIVVR
ncbi:MAG: hypothetical protein K2O01_06380 [Bacteroidales bacterium]|nr:hypothetical protein [Bacteroidales bacterium]